MAHPIVDFYKDCDIFVTGGSGAVGKALIEKLLRSCQVNRIFVLLRPKKNLSVEERMQKLLTAKIFRVLTKTQPFEINKLIAVPGDVTLPKLGITAADAEMLARVSFVFHCAATVRFDAPLIEALTLNVGGTYEALKFAETLKQLKLFMHVSTFFSNPYLKCLESKVYPAPMDWKLCLNMLQDENKHDNLDILTKKLIIGFPNTYTFTKNIAESLVDEYRHRLPVAIYRPAIVLFAIDEPEPGFPPSLIGAIGLFVVVAAGILKTVYLGKNIRFDITPQDAGIKLMLFYGYKANQIYEAGKLATTPVYLVSSSSLTNYTFRELCEFMDNNNIWDLVPLEKSFLIPGCRYTSSRLLYLFLVFTKQIIPGMLCDELIKLFGYPPVIMRVVRKAFVSLEVMKPFMFNNFESTATTHFDEVLQLEKIDSYFSLPDVEFVTSAEGIMKSQISMLYRIRDVLLNESPESLPRARKYMKIKKNTYLFIRLIISYYILTWFYRYLSSYFSG